MSKVKPDAARDKLWHRLTLITLGLTALVSLCYLVVLLSPSLMSGFLSAEEMTSTPAVALARCARFLRQARSNPRVRM